MDDHMYIIDEKRFLADSVLIQNFIKEYREHGKVTSCPSYRNVKSFCIFLNSFSTYTGFSKLTPSSIISEFVGNDKKSSSLSFYK